MDEFALWFKSGGLWELDGFHKDESAWMARLMALSESMAVEDWRAFRVKSWAWPSSLPRVCEPPRM